MGDEMTAADVTFACLGYGLVFPPEHRELDLAIWPDDLPEDGRAHVRRWRQTRAGKHALRMFREFRWPASEAEKTARLAAAEPSGVRLIRQKKGGSRNRVPWALLAAVLALLFALVFARGKL